MRTTTILTLAVVYLGINAFGQTSSDASTPRRLFLTC